MYKKCFKRVLDLVLAIILLVFLWPIYLIVAVMIKLDSKGPVLFKQERSGKGDKPFTLYKFRSCVKDNNINDRSKGDSITRAGKFIRKTSLDELPQLLNIIKGDMSFIGPRPWVLEYSKNFTKRQSGRLNVLPGITGLAQVNGRNELDINSKIDCDLEYVAKISLEMDIKIVFLTIQSVFTSDGVADENKLTVHHELDTLRENKLKEEIKEYQIKEEKMSKKKNKKQIA